MANKKIDKATAAVHGKAVSTAVVSLGTGFQKYAKFESGLMRAVTDLRQATCRSYGEVQLEGRLIGKIQFRMVQVAERQPDCTVQENVTLDELCQAKTDQAHADNRTSSIDSLRQGRKIAEAMSAGSMNGSTYIAETSKAAEPSIARYVAATASRDQRSIFFGDEEIALGGIPGVPGALPDTAEALTFQIFAPPVTRKDGQIVFKCQPSRDSPALGLPVGRSFELAFEANDRSGKLLAISQSLQIPITAVVSSTVAVKSGARHYLLEKIHNLEEVRRLADDLFSELLNED